MRDSFSSMHPVVNFGYFTVVLAVGMLFLHPVQLAISFCCAMAYSIYLNGRKAFKFNFLYMLPLLLLAAIIHPTFSHAGVTILLYINGNPLTLESIIYGVVTSVMLISVIMWFSCYNSVMTSDKFIYLFGRVIPALSLVLSMALRFVPRFKAQIKIIANAQRCIGRDMNTGNILTRAKNGVKILSIITTWALENAIETADSMKSRGYGLPRRTSFSIFTFDSRDKFCSILMLMFLAIIVAGIATGQFRAQYFPRIIFPEILPWSVCVNTAYAMFCLTPLTIDLLEDIKWKYLESII